MPGGSPSFVHIMLVLPVSSAVYSAAGIKTAVSDEALTGRRKAQEWGLSSQEDVGLNPSSSTSICVT